MASFSSTAFSVTAFSVTAWDIAGAGPSPDPVEESLGGAFGNKRKKKYRKILRYSDYGKEELAKEIKAALQPIPMSSISDSPVVHDGPDDDDVLLQAVLMRILH